MTDRRERPDFCTDEMLRYLNELRETNDINMFMAGPYLQEEFDLSRQQAKEVILYWMYWFEENADKTE